MLRRDYILDLIRRAGPSLKRIFGLRQADKVQEAQQAVQAGLREVLNLDLNMVLSLSAKDLQGLLGMDEGQAAAKGIVIAEFLAEHAENLLVQGHETEARSVRAKATEYFRWVAEQPGGKEFVDASERASRLDPQ